MNGGEITDRPEIVDENIENAQDHHKDDGTPLRLEADDHHDAGYSTDRNDNEAPEVPLARRHKANEQENQQNAAGQLEVHLAIFLVKLGQAGGSEALAHPAVGEGHDQSSQDADIAEEKVQIEDQAVTNGLDDDYTDQCRDGVLAAFADDHKNAGAGHGDDVGDQEEVRESGGN